MRRQVWLAAGAAAAWVAASFLVAGDRTEAARETGETGPRVDFARQIRPILSNNCFVCHGPDEGTREAGLRLDTFDTATAELRSGVRAIVPGSPESSELIARVSADSSRVRMPPAHTGKQLSPDQIALLAQWIREGAEYTPHWAFVKPGRPALPPVDGLTWPRNGLDYFVLARLEAEGLQPSPEADPYTLVRRLYLDLSGVPPTPEEADTFANDPSPVAYEKLVQRLLDDPRYGERWARTWLDIARYADTKGYEQDQDRIIWRYRDWVIDAFNRDLPFDQFTIQQLAGDMLPDPDTGQLLATAFHRNTMTNDEGGTDDEEFRVAAVVDRVNTTMEVWMGITMACAQCHSHKYDPISLDEYYQFFAFFNQSEDADRVDEAPVLKAPTREQQTELDAIDARLAQVRDQMAQLLPELRAARADWEREVLERGNPEPELSNWWALGPFAADSYEAAFDTAFGPEERVDLKQTFAGPDGELSWREAPDWTDGEIHRLTGTNAANYLYRTVHVDTAMTAVLSLGSNDGLRVWVNGTEVLSRPVLRQAAPDQDQVQAPLEPGGNTVLLKVVNEGGGHSFYFNLLYDTAPELVLTGLAEPPAGRTDEEAAAIDDYYMAVAPEFRAFRETAATLTAARERLEAEIPPTPIMRELPPDQQRDTHILVRGNFLDKGKQVAPGVPAVFHPMPHHMPRNRLGLARWLMDENNPLTARVTVNRYWQHFFGAGIVETSEDLGTQGELPSHPELLDWLATEFMQLGWSMKELCRLIVTSATYRQASAATPELIARDPYNRLFARGPRFRLDAERIRDQALAASGLLDGTMYGPSVKPYQPEGVWTHYGGHQWVQSEGSAQYRRGLYVFWRRTAPYPMMTTFDAPSREICTVRRMRTNTPLQALQLLNDPVYIEAAQALARRVLSGGGAAPEERAGYAFRLVLARPPTETELAHLTGLYQSAHQHYRAHPDAALAMATQPLGPLPPGAVPAELAAWTVVCNVVLNLDEAVSKR